MPFLHWIYPQRNAIAFDYSTANNNSAKHQKWNKENICIRHSDQELYLFTLTHINFKTYTQHLIYERREKKNKCSKLLCNGVQVCQHARQGTQIALRNGYAYIFSRTYMRIIHVFGARARACSHTTTGICILCLLVWIPNKWFACSVDLPQYMQYKSIMMLIFFLLGNFFKSIRKTDWL